MDPTRMFIIVVVMLAASVSADPVCTKQTLCSCTTDKGTIDLSLLPQKVLKCNDPAGTAQFVYSPCAENNTSPCLNAMLCRSTISDHQSIGMSSGESFVEKDGKIAIEYPGEDNKTSMVLLNCDPNQDGALSIVKDASDDDAYVFELTSRYVCVGASPATSTVTPKTTKKTTPKSTTPKKTTPKKTPKMTTKTTKKTTPHSTSTPHSTTPHSTSTPHSTTPHSTTPHSTSSPHPHSKKSTTHKVTTPTTLARTTHHGAATSNHGSFKIVTAAVLLLISRQFL